LAHPGLLSARCRPLPPRKGHSRKATRVGACSSRPLANRLAAHESYANALGVHSAIVWENETRRSEHYFAFLPAAFSALSFAHRLPPEIFWLEQQRT
jgi:hypothetical protein